MTTPIATSILSVRCIACRVQNRRSPAERRYTDPADSEIADRIDIDGKCCGFGRNAAASCGEVLPEALKLRRTRNSALPDGGRMADLEPPG